VQTPTLAIVVEREEQIRKFISRDYWEIHGSFLADAGEYPGKWFDPKWKKDPDGRREEGRPVWSEKEARAIADAVRGKAATVTEESKPTTQAAPGLFDLTSLQREANGRFGYSAKTTLALAQSLYERHKALTYPRTDSRHLPQDYVPVVHDTMKMLADSGMGHLAPFAQQAIKEQYVKPVKRVFDDSKVSDHFAIIPTLQAPSGLSGRRTEAVRPGGAPLPGGVLPQRRIPGHHPHQPGGRATTSRPRARCWSSRAGWPSTARKPPPKWTTPRKATRARTWCR
jgi:DNA topoisomerase-3